MRYRVYVGPRGSEAISPLQKDQFLFKTLYGSFAGRCPTVPTGAKRLRL